MDPLSRITQRLHYSSSKSWLPMVFSLTRYLSCSMLAHLLNYLLFNNATTEVKCGGQNVGPPKIFLFLDKKSILQLRRLIS